MTTNYNSKVFSIIFITCAILGSSDLLAWNATECDGQIMGGIRSSGHDWSLNRYSIPEGSTREDDVLAAMDEWDNIIGMNNRFQNRVSGSMSSTINHDDDYWTIFYATMENLDGALGVTFLTIEPCWWPYASCCDGSLDDAADVGIASDYGSFDTGDINDCNTDSLVPRRNVVVHELGHVLGAHHDNNTPCIMNSDTGPGDVHKYCGTHAAAPLPNDIDFGVEYHGSGSDSYDAAPSSFYLASDDNFSPTTSSGTLLKCPGDSFSFSWSISNRGTNDFSGIITKIYLSTDKTITSSDIFVEDYTTTRPAFAFARNSKTATIPSGVSWDTEYYIGVRVDTENAIGEYYESNNYTYLRQKIKIKPALQCLILP